jgi:hypothetical protein
LVLQEIPARCVLKKVFVLLRTCAKTSLIDLATSQKTSHCTWPVKQNNDILFLRQYDFSHVENSTRMNKPLESLINTTTQ